MTQSSCSLLIIFLVIFSQFSVLIASPAEQDNVVTQYRAELKLEDGEVQKILEFTENEEKIDQEVQAVVKEKKVELKKDETETAETGPKIEKKVEGEDALGTSAWNDINNIKMHQEDNIEFLDEEDLLEATKDYIEDLKEKDENYDTGNNDDGNVHNEDHGDHDDYVVDLKNDDRDDIVGDYNDENDNSDKIDGNLNDDGHENEFNDNNDFGYAEHNHENRYFPPLLTGPPYYAIPIENEDGTEEPVLEYDLDFPSETIVDGAGAVCFTNDLKEMKKRCKRAKLWGTEVYVLAFNRTGELTNNIGDVKSIYETFDDTWYEGVAELKNETGLKVFGLIFEMDNLEKKFELLNAKTDVYDGFLVDWETQRGACYTKVPQLKTTKPIRYAMVPQDWETCPGEFDVFVNNNKRKFPIPKHISAAFPCFAGLEGRCFRSFVGYPEDSCDGTNQMHVFTPWERASSAMWFLLKTVCENLKKPMPPHIFAQVI